MGIVEPRTTMVPRVRDNASCLWCGDHHGNHHPDELRYCVQQLRKARQDPAFVEMWNDASV